MFLLDNDTVRQGWKAAKAQVTDMLTKHGATLHTARRWDERRLAYTIKRRSRASYLLCHFDLPTDKGPALTRDLELRETVLRHLIVRTEEVPPSEVELAAAEHSDDFLVPAPPLEEFVAMSSETPDVDESPRSGSRRAAASATSESDDSDETDDDDLDANTDDDTKED
jgi:small subunit ribosomal protein S6